MSLSFKDLRCNADIKFTDISTELYRTYEYPTNVVHIKQPVALNVSRSGGHRILDADGVSHYIPTGWVHLCWKARDDDAHFVT